MTQRRSWGEQPKMRYSNFYRRPSFAFGMIAGIPLFLLISATAQVLVFVAWIVGALMVVLLLAAVAASVSGAQNMKLLERENEERHEQANLIRQKRREKARALNAQPRNEKAIGQRPSAYVAGSASTTGGHMNYDPRFALVDTEGNERFPAIINGTFQIGKARDAMPTDIEAFARAILVHAQGGRFVRADGGKPGILKFSGRAREAVAYRLDPAIAAALEIPASGSR